MKKTLVKLSLIGFLFCTTLQAQFNRPINNFTSIDRFIKNNFLYSMNDVNSLLEMKIIRMDGEGWDGTNWNMNLQQNYFYNSTGNLIEETSQDKTSGNWVNNTRATYTYGSDNRMNLAIFYDWLNGSWVQDVKIEFTYTANTIVQTSYNWINGAWQLDLLTTMTYTNEILTETINKEWQNGAWVNVYKFTYTISQGKVQTILGLQWKNDAWSNSSLVTYNYSNNNLSLSTTQTWQNGAWAYGLRTSYTYDSNNNNTQILQEAWSGGVWNNFIKTTITYNANNLKQIETGQIWLSNSWMNSYRYTYYYQNITAVEKNNLPAAFALFQNYPNPFNPETVISYQLSDFSHVILKVYDILGREIVTLVNEYQQAGIHKSKFIIQNSSLPSKIYFYRITVGNFSAVRKMLLIK